MTQDNTELLPCPFCGGEGAFCETRYTESHEAWWDDGSQVLHAHFISCVKCGGNRRSIVGGSQTKAEAITAWNTRTTQGHDALVDALKRADEALSDALSDMQGGGLSVCGAVKKFMIEAHADVQKALLTNLPSPQVEAAPDYGLVAELEAENARLKAAWEDHLGQQYAPWKPADPEDTLGAMIDNQAWVMMSHIGSHLSPVFDDEMLMEDWQDEWAERHDELLKGWFSPHRAMACFVAKKIAEKYVTALRARPSGDGLVIAPAYVTGDMDCTRACVATILGKQTADVPNFYRMADGEGLDHSINMKAAIRDYLHTLGLASFETYCPGDWPLEKVIEWASGDNPGCPIILHGTPNNNDAAHSVVLLDGKIAHDPSGAGIVGPVECSDGKRWWFLEVICATALRAPLPADDGLVAQIENLAQTIIELDMRGTEDAGACEVAELRLREYAALRTRPSDDGLAAELDARITNASDMNLADGGRYFDETFRNFTECRHGDCGEYTQGKADGELVEFLWNNRHAILTALRARPSGEGGG